MSGPLRCKECDGRIEPGECYHALCEDCWSEKLGLSTADRAAVVRSGGVASFVFFHFGQHSCHLCGTKTAQMIHAHVDVEGAVIHEIRLCPYCLSHMQRVLLENRSESRRLIVAAKDYDPDTFSTKGPF